MVVEIVENSVSGRYYDVSLFNIDIVLICALWLVLAQALFALS